MGQKKPVVVGRQFYRGASIWIEVSGNGKLFTPHYTDDFGNHCELGPPSNSQEDAESRAIRQINELKTS